MALKNGASIEEICESLFQVAAYAGYPAMWDALEILGGVLDCEQTSREENA
jgi:alkylhydroperoxidase/carboxymuconolactone decarboxylase family protein YurZ